MKAFFFYSTKTQTDKHDLARPAPALLKDILKLGANSILCKYGNLVEETGA